MKWKRPLLALILLGVAAMPVTLYGLRQWHSDSNTVIRRWLREPESRPLLNTPNDATCGDAPFLLPSAGLIGLLWGDTARPYNILRRHTGIDIFGDGPNGTVPIVAAYDGWLTREDGWLATVAIRHDDPLQPGRVIWTYYTHMANADGSESYVHEAFPRGTHEQFVEQGTLLGYQGDYNGSGPWIAMHLHLSIVTSEADGSLRNEAVLSNTLDPSPYFGLPLNFADRPAFPIRCP